MLDHLCGLVPYGRCREAADMWGCSHVVAARQPRRRHLIIRRSHIEGRACDEICIKSCLECDFIDKLSTRYVDEKGRPLHPTECFCVDENLLKWVPLPTGP